MKKIFGIVLILLCVIFISTCSVKAPEVTISGDKTALENQVIGTYREIEQDSWTIASVRSNRTAQQQPLSEEKKQVLTAVQNRRFNKDDVNELKRDGAIGESTNGLLEVRDHPKIERDEEYRRRVEKIVADENRDRQIIFNRTMQINEQAAQAGDQKISQIFAKIYQDDSEPGTWIELEDGKWVKKKAEKNK